MPLTNDPWIIAAGLARALPADAPLAVVADRDRVVVATEPDRVLRLDGARARDALRDLAEGWWAGVLRYDLGRAFERVPALHPPRADEPDLEFARFTARVEIGTDGIEVVGTPGATATLLRALDRADYERPLLPAIPRWESSLTRTEWVDRVVDVVARLRAGDCYQVNLTRNVESRSAIDPRCLFATLAHMHPAPHRALVSLGPVATVSASPECFLRIDGSSVVSRPIKGTDRSRARLLASDKDRVENVMIVDLVRNDLDRVCQAGSVMVDALCEAEHHPGLVHLVSTVSGHLRDDVSFADVIAATFPPASVTGVPKVAVLRAIEALESGRRGAYCGAVGWYDTATRRGDFSVAIRTFSVGNDFVRLGVGAGITAASDPIAEWNETELKAERLLAAFGAGIGSEAFSWR